ncbi:EAL domain-containing protein (putative c-di-GMP-specific phosphodiesterase class I) [Halospina denitrificans]|uniref:EAL domain-containing protein (Putative c-di-GMP-specific phosphodiesterase class I) n=1 Tax=Halospina denitrificans TaxID=332522 RepID=A0A4R7JUF5_9GAMM|nr:EAL domain-containing protein [Halospina denitrificans]TDT41695.1 EAL domain-containing protein (putative c-di-GMP-specific phosphodiesterase class I) [Halospina denitrificans]
MIISRLLLFVVFAAPLACVPSAALAEPGPVEITPSAPIQAHFHYLEDPSGGADLEQIREWPEDEWQLAESGNATLGITSSPYWLRFSVRNDTGENLNMVAELAYSQLDDVTFHLLNEGRVVREFATGDTRPFYPRDIDHPSMLLRFNLEPEQARTLYIRVQTQGSMILPLRLWREHNFFETATREQKLHFFYYGAILVIILINLVVFLKLRERLYLFYALAIAGYLLFFSSIHGYSFQHIYPQFPVVHGRVLLLSMPILALFSVLFCREFLRIKSHSPLLDIAIRAMIYFEIFNLMAALVLSYNVAIKISAISSFFFFSLLFVAGPITWAKGVRAGMFFTIAWTPLTIGVLATGGRAMGFFPDNFMTEYAMQVGSGLEAFILTLALADRLYREREDKIQAQAESLRKEKARHEAYNWLANAMMHDAVTGLPNRNRFERMVNERLQSDPEGHYMVGVCRITRLDEINRTLGLNRSERLLQRIARNMRALASELPVVHSRRDDRGQVEQVYQLSGDSFGLLVDVNRVKDDFKGLDRALKQLSEPVQLDNLAIELHPKFGAATYPAHGSNAALLIRNAHVGMEITPRDNFEVGFYSRRYDIYSESRLTLMSDLRDALQRDETELHYQPKACLASGAITGVEALIRWHHPERGWVYPADFVPLAEETGVITHLTRWAFDRGIRDLSVLLADNPSLTMSINISARDLVSNDLRDLIESTLARYKVPADHLTVELTETAAMDDPEKGWIALEKLAELGVKVAIDDFGSGYSSLSYLKQLPATEIKLDRSLIKDLCTSDSSRVIVQTAINMAHGLGYELVAEGVEDEGTARVLKRIGCDRFQGYWLCHPLPLEPLKRWLSEPHEPLSDK